MLPQSYLKELESNEIILFLIPGEEMLTIIINLVKEVSKNGYHIIYITANKPYATINNIFKKEEIDLGRVFFIDVVTNLTGASMQRTGNCIFSSAQGLTHVGITVKNIVEELPKEAKKILFIDSLSTLMIYNKPDVMGMFTLSLMAKLREWDVKCIAYMLEVEADRKLIEHIASFCDKEIKIKS